MAQTLVFGLVSGLVIALASLGMALIFAQFNFINFAYGEFLTLGGYVYVALGGARLGWAAAAVAALSVGALGLVAHLLIFKPLVRQGPIIMLVASMGLSYGAQNVMIAIWGTGVIGVSVPTIPLRVGLFGSLQVTITLITIVLASLVALILYRTPTGRQLRAAADNRVLASISGVNLRKVALLTWGLGSVLAGIAGVMLAAYGNLTPTMGYTSLFPIVAAVLISGGKNPFRAAGAGVVIGVANEFAAYYVGSAYKPAMSIAVLALVLFLSVPFTKAARV